MLTITTKDCPETTRVRVNVLLQAVLAAANLCKYCRVFKFILIDKIIIYKIIKGTRKADPFVFIDYCYRPASVQNSVRVDKQND